MNRLNGTVPPQLGNLSQLTYLYAQNRFVFLDNVYRYLMGYLRLRSLTIIVHSHSFIATASGVSTRISSLAPFRLTSAASESSCICTLRIASFSLALFIISSALFSMGSTRNRCVFSLTHCRALSFVNSNQFTGTVPSELGNLKNLTQLYAQSRIEFFDHVPFEFIPSSLYHQFSRLGVSTTAR